MVTELLRTHLADETNATTLTLCGEIDMSNASELAAAIELAFLFQPHTLVIEVSGITFCDCSGLGQFVLAAQECGRQGVNFRVVRPTPSLQRVFVLAGLAGLLERFSPVRRHAAPRGLRRM